MVNSRFALNTSPPLSFSYCSNDQLNERQGGLTHLSSRVLMAHFGLECTNKGLTKLCGGGVFLEHNN